MQKWTDGKFLPEIMSMSRGLYFPHYLVHVIFWNLKKKSIDQNPGKKEQKEKITCHFKSHGCCWNMMCLLPPVIDEQQVCGCVVKGFCWQQLIPAFNTATDFLALPCLLHFRQGISLELCRLWQVRSQNCSWQKPTVFQAWSRLIITTSYILLLTDSTSVVKSDQNLPC